MFSSKQPWGIRKFSSCTAGAGFVLLPSRRILTTEGLFSWCPQGSNSSCFSPLSLTLLFCPLTPQKAASSFPAPQTALLHYFILGPKVWRQTETVGETCGHSSRCPPAPPSPHAAVSFFPFLNWDFLFSFLITTKVTAKHIRHVFCTRYCYKPMQVVTCHMMTSRSMMDSVYRGGAILL